jgi:hypothetical protein
MPQRRFTDPLSMDMTTDLDRVDGVMTRLLKDRDLWTDFIRDPNGVFVRLGLHPPTTDEINARVNRMFYATLTNRRLIKLLHEHFKDFRPSKRKFAQHYVSRLKKGIIQHDVEIDLESIDYLIRSPEVLRDCLRLALQDWNTKGILQKKYSRKEINDYIEGVMVAAQARKALSAHPKLEIWDRNYGIGQPMAGFFAEVGPIATVAALVEVAVEATVDFDVDVNVPTASAGPTFVEAGSAAEGGPTGPIGILMRQAFEGDDDSIRAVAILGRLMDLSGELLVHAYTFEARQL